MCNLPIGPSPRYAVWNCILEVVLLNCVASLKLVYDISIPEYGIYAHSRDMGMMRNGVMSFLTLFASMRLPTTLHRRRSRKLQRPNHLAVLAQATSVRS
jgi:hypothetical protein